MPRLLKNLQGSLIPAGEDISLIDVEDKVRWVLIVEKEAFRLVQLTKACFLTFLSGRIPNFMSSASRKPSVNARSWNCYYG